MTEAVFKTTQQNHRQLGWDYEATVGIMPLKDDAQQLLATMSYFAYFKVSNENRPITFIWGGGPGYCSMLTNFGTTGPMLFNPDTDRIEENAQTWLEFTDLVYIDMIGSGWGRLAKSENTKLFYTPAGDADSFSQFIENFLRTHQRLSSPIYLGGSSYGGFRGPIVAKNLLRATMPVQGIFLGSPMLNYNYCTPCEFGNDLPYVLAIPTFIRAALHHKKLTPALQANPQQTLKEGIEWSQHIYPNLLLQGDSLSETQKNELAKTLHHYTGLDPHIIHKNHYRISTENFCNHLLDELKINYLDIRLSEHELTDNYGYFLFSMSNLMELQLAIYPHALNYINEQLEFTQDLQYVVYLPPDDWYFDPAFKQVISILRDCLLIDDKLKAFVALGYFDIDIPYMSNIAAVNHLLLPENARDRVQLKCYEEAHIFSSNPKSLKTVRDDIKKFLF